MYWYVLIICSFLLNACSPVKNYIENRDNFYLNSQEGQPLKTTTSNHETITTEYAIPPAYNNKIAKSPPSLIPPY